MKNKDILSALEWRYAVKKFDVNQKISEENLQTIVKSIQLTPTSLGLQFFTIFIVENQLIKNKLKVHSYNQNQIDSCSHILVFTIPNDVTNASIDATIEQRKAAQNLSDLDTENLKKMSKNFVSKLSPIEVTNWLSSQCYIALGNAITVCSLLEIDTCPMEGFVKDQYDEILELHEQNVSTVVALAIGYRSKDDLYINQKKFRKPIEELFVKK